MKTRILKLRRFNCRDYTIRLHKEQTQPITRNLFIPARK